MNYTPPPGFIDQPYFWCFDTDTIANASVIQNQQIDIPGGFDFLLRRVTGVDSVLNATTGEFMFRGVGNRNFGNLNFKKPAKWADRLIIPEIAYPETSGISFDLFNTLKASITVGEETIPYGQLAFQGARRRRGEDALVYGRSFRRIPFHIKMEVNLNWGYASTRRSRKFAFVVDNFDFEMHDLYWTVDGDPITSEIITTSGGVAKFCLYDYAGNGLMPVPMLIRYLNEPLPFGAVPAATYKSGAIYPVLVYPKDSAISFDVVSLLPASQSYTLALNALGMQRIPC